MLGEIKENNKGTKMKIIAQRSTDDIDVEFLDDYHYVFKHNIYQNFKSGGIKNPFDKTVYGVGYLGDGKYNGWVNGKPTVEYYIWQQIICRCYNENDKEKYGSYYDISEVCSEWLNFQNFAQWYNEHKYECDGRLHVDKDIKYPGNKLYSPYHCILVPQRINMLFSNKRNKRGLPNGIQKNKKGYLAKYNGEELGRFSTLEEAYTVYSKAKKNAIIIIANEYKNQIPEEVYNALLNYEVRIENDKNYTIAQI